RTLARLRRTRGVFYVTDLLLARLVDAPLVALYRRFTPPGVGRISRSGRRARAAHAHRAPASRLRGSSRARGTRVRGRVRAGLHPARRLPDSERDLLRPRAPRRAQSPPRRAARLTRRGLSAVGVRPQSPRERGLLHPYGQRAGGRGRRGASPTRSHRRAVVAALPEAAAARGLARLRRGSR